MLFHSALRKDLSRSFGATVVVLSTIVMTNVLIRTLGQATVGGVNPSEIMLVMGFSVLSHLTTILTLSLFISIVSTLSRMYADSEMVIWFASGRGLASFAPPVFRFAWPILLTITALAWWSGRGATVRPRTWLTAMSNAMTLSASHRVNSKNLQGVVAFFSSTKTAQTIKRGTTYLYPV